MKTLGQLVTDVKNLVDDPGLPDDLVKGWINEGLGDLTPVLRLEGRAVADVSAGQSEYGLPEDFFDVRALKLASEEDVRDPVLFTDYTSVGYKIWGKTLIFQPELITDDKVELWYWRVPPALVNDTDKPEVPGPFQHLLTWFAAAMYQVYDKEVELERTLYYPKYQGGKAALNRYTAARSSKYSIPKRWRMARR